jgi:hypothetical protein
VRHIYLDNYIQLPQVTHYAYLATKLVDILKSAYLVLEGRALEQE